MFAQLKNLENTLRELEPVIGKRQVEIDNVFIWLDKYLRIVFGNQTIHLKGDEQRVALDAVLNISIQLFESIDTGDEGLDEKLAEQFRKIKEQYLGS